MVNTSLSSPGALLPRPTLGRIWWAAIRPNTLTAAVTPVFVGSALAASDHFWHAGPAIAALLGAILIQIGTNLFNDYADFVKGADTPDRVGPPRATQQGWLAPRHVAIGAVISFLAATGVGVYLMMVAGWPIVVVGVLSILAGILYTGGPRPLAYVGLGDVFVLLFFGVVAVCGTYYVQALRLGFDVFVAGLAIGCLATAILVVNNLRDRHTDKAAGKRTWAVRWGARFARIEHTFLIAFAYLLLLWAPLVGNGSAGWLLPLLSLPLAIPEIRAVWRKDGAALNPHLGGTARVGLVFGLLLTLGVLL